jgi:hypothetical protein
VDDVRNVHPLHINQNNALWEQALQKANLEDYDDLEQLRELKSKSVLGTPLHGSKLCSIFGLGSSSSHTTFTSWWHFVSSVNMTATLATTTTTALGAPEATCQPQHSALPSKYYRQYNNYPDRSAERVVQVREVFSDLEKMVSNGGREVYDIALCRLKQAISECEGAVDPLSGMGTMTRPPVTAAGSKRRSSGELRNKSTMKKSRNSADWFEDLVMDDLKRIARASCQFVTAKNKTELITRLKRNDDVRAYGLLSDRELHQLCNTAHVEGGSKLDMVLRLLCKKNGSEFPPPKKKTTVAVGAASRNSSGDSAMLTGHGMTRDQVAILGNLLTSLAKEDANLVGDGPKREM